MTVTTTGSVPAYQILLRKDVMSVTGEPCFIAEDPAVPGSIGYGETEDEAIEMLGRARRAILHDLGGREDPPFQVENMGLTVSSQGWRHAMVA